MPRFFALLLVLLCFNLAACSEEVQFENWMTKKGGQWRLKTLEEAFVLYAAGDSTLTNTSVSLPEGNFFTFTKEGMLTYNFYSNANFRAFSGAGPYTIEGELFRYSQTFDSVGTGPIILGMKGYEWRRDEMEIKARIEFYDEMGDLITAEKADLRLERWLTD
ncbi:MAG: hypothetical protein AAGN35_09155 [Bacteroidota bacterium]